jgi:hypothetical protein
MQRANSISFLFLSLTLVLASCSRTGPPETAAIEAAYRAYEAALEAGDVAALQGLLAGDARNELSTSDASQKMEVIKAFRPKVTLLLNIAITNDAATMQMEGKLEGETATADVHLIKEEGAWKVLKENWSISMSIEAGDLPLEATTEPFMKDPKNPPRAWKVLEGHQAEVTDVAFLEGERLASISYGDYTLRLWDLAAGAQLGEAKMGNRPRDLLLTADGRTLLVADAYLNVSA